MKYITEELVRRRAEHNDGELFSLEELSLHQQDLQKIQHLDHLCRDLRILLLHNNLITRIENVGRLKKLKYLNLALNNIEVIENLEGCESLQKLDLTLNFVGCVSSVAALTQNIHLRELFLLGNPCADFQGYRPYVVTLLPQLQFLDGKEISRSERLQAAQGLLQLRAVVHRQEEEYLQRRQREREEPTEEPRGQETTAQHQTGSAVEQLSSEERAEYDFWNTPCSDSPESRLAIHRYMEEKRRARDKSQKAEKKSLPSQTLITAEGRVLNVNQPKLDFCLTEDEENNTIVLDLSVYRHLDTSLMEVDIQPQYVRVTVKGKVFQMVLPAEVKADRSTAQRSQTTGHLLLTMPRAEGEIQVKNNTAVHKRHSEACQHTPQVGAAQERLEVEPSGLVDLTNIVSHSREAPHSTKGPLELSQAVLSEPSVSQGFVDDPTVPPLI